MRLSQWVVASMLVAALSVPGFANAETFKIGTLEWDATIEFLPWETAEGFVVKPIAGTKAHVENDSPVDFLNVWVGAGWHYVSVNATEACPFSVVSARAASPECTTGPVYPAPALPNGIFYEAFVSGTLGASSFVLSDGTTFIPNSTSFGVNYITGAVSQTPITTSLDILVDGRIMQQEEPPQPIPEPGTLTLIAAGAVSAYTARQRRQQ